MNSLNNFLMIAISLMFLVSSNIFSQVYEGRKLVNVTEWEKVFEESGVDGTFLLHQLYSDTLFAYNSSRIKTSYLPASTFKILNSLVSLETGTISNENEIIKWDGKKRFYDKWNQDQSLRSAIKYSCVWFYQELARRVGKERMQNYLNAADYGNKIMGANIDTFWLEGDLRISALEQVLFLEKFLRKDLPFSTQNLLIVKDILLVDSTANSKLFAKTGWAARIDNQIGWYVGFVEKESEIWIFAMNIDIKSNEDASLRKNLTESILKIEGIF
ncbi:MAG: class D beta-lactamase [Melioribacteraceae bacterium]|nr:class D beta-lactamase [Melioribacteraceae bacterium]